MLEGQEYGFPVVLVKCGQESLRFRSLSFAEGEMTERTASVWQQGATQDKMKMLMTRQQLFSVFFLRVLGFSPLDFVLPCPLGPDSISVCGLSQELAARSGCSQRSPVEGLEREQAAVCLTSVIGDMKTCLHSHSVVSRVSREHILSTCKSRPQASVSRCPVCGGRGCRLFLLFACGASV